MRDRLPTPGKAGRVRFCSDNYKPPGLSIDGNGHLVANYESEQIEGVLEHADDASVDGSVYCKANVLPDTLCNALGINADESEPKDAFNVLAAWARIATTHAKIVIGVFDGSGSPYTGWKLSGCGTPEPVVGANGLAVAYLPPGTYTIGILNEVTEYVDYRHGELTITVEAGKIYNETLPLATQFKIMTTQNIKFSPNVAEVDVFCVGGGAVGQEGDYSSGAGAKHGAGGGGGFTKTGLNVVFEPDVEYLATVGAGGTTRTNTGSAHGTYQNQNGGMTSLLGVEAEGGCTDWYYKRGGAGGSGGAGGRGNYHGGVDGANGEGSTDSDYAAGVGQGSTTRPFGDPTAEPAYAKGGDSGYNSPVDRRPDAAEPNTGNGGQGGYARSSSDGGSQDGGYGGSGIIIVRWRLAA